MIPVIKISEIAAAKGNKAAIITQNETITWRHFGEEANKYIRLLTHISKSNKLETLCFISPNRLELFYLLSAAASLKITAFGLDYTQKQETLLSLMRLSDVDAVVVSSNKLTQIGLEPQHLVAGRPSIDFDEVLYGSLAPSKTLTDEVSVTTPTERSFRAIGFTSGTSGVPKVVYRDKSFDPKRFAYFTTRYDFSSADRHLVTIPLYHAAGNGWARLFLNLGATVVLAPGDNLEIAADLLITHGITTTAMTPPIAVGVSRILDEYNRSPTPGVLKFVLVGGKNFSPVDKFFCNRVLKNAVHEYYGTTETGVNTIAEPDDILSKPDSVGKAYDGNEIMIFDQKGNPVPTGEIGRIGVHSYMNMTGYIGSDADNVMVEGRRFILTNEAGYLDDEEYLFLRNRNVSTSVAPIYEVEGEIKRLPCITDIALVPNPNEKQHNIICAFVIAEDAISKPHEIAKRITKIVKKGKLRISSISNLDQIPYSPSGKVIANKVIDSVRENSIVANTNWKSSIFVGIGLLSATAVAWGGMFHVAKSALTTIDAFHVSLIRYGLAAIVFLSMLLFTEGARSLFPGKDAFKLWFFGTLGFAGFSILAFWGLAFTRPEHGAIIMALMPFLTVIIMMVWKGASISKFTAACVFLAFCGVLLVITKGDLSSIYGGALIPNLAIMTGACCWVVYTIGAREFPNYSILRYTALSASLGAVSIFALTMVGTWANFLTSPTIEQLYQFKLELAYLVVIAGVIAVFSWNNGIRMLGPINGVLFINLVPITALIFGWWKGHVFYEVELLGGAITVAALIFNNLNERGVFKNPRIASR